MGKNSYGHPNSEVLERLEEIKTNLYTTQNNGTIWIKSDGNLIYINDLDYNIDGANRKVSYVENLNILTLYYFKIFQFLSTT